MADAARAELRGPDWLACTRRLELEHDNLWAALAYARDAPDPAIAVRLGAGLGWYFALAERVSEGRSFLEAALAAASAATLVGKQIELLAFLCYLATEELDLDAAIDVGRACVWPLPRPVLQRPSRPSHGWRSRSPSRFSATTSGRQRWRRRRASATAEPETIGAWRRAAWSGPRVPSTPERSPPLRP